MSWEWQEKASLNSPVERTTNIIQKQRNWCTSTRYD